MLVANITENLLSRGSYLVTLGSNSDVSCSGVTGDEALAFNKEDTVNVSGVIYDHTFGVINLNYCVFSRSVPAIQQPQGSMPAPPWSKLRNLLQRHRSFMSPNLRRLRKSFTFLSLRRPPRQRSYMLRRLHRRPLHGQRLRA